MIVVEIQVQKNPGRLPGTIKLLSFYRIKQFQLPHPRQLI